MVSFSWQWASFRALLLFPVPELRTPRGHPHLELHQRDHRPGFRLSAQLRHHGRAHSVLVKNRSVFGARMLRQLLPGNCTDSNARHSHLGIEFTTPVGEVRTTLGWDEFG